MPNIVETVRPGDFVSYAKASVKGGIEVGKVHAVRGNTVDLGPIDGTIDRSRIVENHGKEGPTTRARTTDRTGFGSGKGKPRGISYRDLEDDL